MKHLAVFNLYPNVGKVVGDCDAFDFEGNPVEIDLASVNAEVEKMEKEILLSAYKRKRAAEYPPITDYIDGVVKGDQAQIDAYIAACQAVKSKYPKPE